MAAPLDGIRVVDFTTAIAGPLCAAMMADLGADVIKIEPPEGEKHRAFRSRIPGSTTDFKTNYGFQQSNRGKRALGVDLRQPAGLALLGRLIATADIFITNLVPGRQARFHLTFDDVRGLKPDIVYALVTGYGSEGADRDKLGFDISAYWANGGIMSLLGEPGGTPPLGRGGFGDYHVATTLLAGTLAALRLRDASGEAQFTETSLFNVGIWGIGGDALAAALSGVAPTPVSRTAPTNPLWNSYRCADGRWVVLVNTRPFPDLWPRFCAMVERPDWIGEGGYNDLDALLDSNVALTAELDRIFATKARDAWERLLDAHHIIWAPVASPLEAIRHPQSRTMGWVGEATSDALGTFPLLNLPFKVAGSSIGIRGPAPEPAADTLAILQELRLSEAEVTQLAVDNAI